MKPIFLAAIFLFPLLAGDPPGFAIWTQAELKHIDAAMAGQANGSQKLGQLGNNQALFSHREESGTPELHETDTDLYVMQGGSGSIIVGGRLVGPRKVAENEVKGTSIEGGTEHKVSAGDIITIPPNTPHQFVVPRHGQASYFRVKIAR
jgi:mannose-6-phosphate isomerase-like protein (cupin superfamily)